jgi:hypothetical protein
VSPYLLGASWWSVGIAGLQLVAGIELIRMGPNHRAIATVAGGATALIEIALAWPLWQPLSSSGGSPGGSQVGLIAGLMFPLVVSLATVVLVNRQVAPMARAMIRRPPP